MNFTVVVDARSTSTSVKQLCRNQMLIQHAQRAAKSISERMCQKEGEIQNFSLEMFIFDLLLTVIW